MSYINNKLCVKLRLKKPPEVIESDYCCIMDRLITQNTKQIRLHHHLDCHISTGHVHLFRVMIGSIIDCSNARSGGGGGGHR